MNAIKPYRVAHFLQRRRIPILPELMRWLMFLIYNSTIPPECIIGEDCIFGHGGIGVVLHPKARIGCRVLIGQGVTIGGNFGGGPPRIMDDVWIGPGARILGDITVGQNSVIGANSVVTRDVPENSIVGGVPAKLIKTIEPGQLDVKRGRLRVSTR